ncbi:hypothetical protein E2C01_027302 [Portunus trituberculatus]|uniref:Uncharacterized protein n=1 Tax=Portunus trituberculatus TaxID=210409 RepID=A0A5B7END8_PORTR|nr:hypothetical protein [Portunus trituberculatus]
MSHVLQTTSFDIERVKNRQNTELRLVFEHTFGSQKPLK